MPGVMTSVFAALASLALLALAFVPLERAFAARPEQRVLRPGLTADLVFFAGQYLVWDGLSLSLLLLARDGVAPDALAGLRGGFAALPLAVQAGVSLLLGDLCVYWFHRACHAFTPLWRIHSVHHSSEHLDFLAAHREHPLDGLLTRLSVNLPAFVLGFPLHLIAAFFAFRGFWAVLIHANVRLPLGPLGWLVGSPELHHWHHARVDVTRHNFSNLAPWVDVVFGTYHRPAGPETYPLGVPEDHPRSYLAHLLHPLRGLLPSAAPNSPRAADGQVARTAR